MNKFKLALAILAALTTAGCGSLGWGGGDAADSGAANPGDSTRPVAKVSDSDITASIQQAFKQDDILAKANVSIRTNQGVVGMSGRLSARAANRAMSVARSAPGVRSVMWDSIEYLPE